MTKKQKRRPEQDLVQKYAKANDCAGMLAAKLLCYEPLVRKSVVPRKKVQNKARTDTQFDISENVFKMFSSLQKLLKGRKPIPFDNREAQYFWSILPFQALINASVLRKHIKPVVMIMSEFLQMKRFIKKNPEKWYEQTMFKKANAYVDTLTKGRLKKKFKKDLAEFRSKHRKLLARSKKMAICPYGEAIPAIEERHEQHKWPQKSHMMKDTEVFEDQTFFEMVNTGFHLDLKELCRKWAIEGFEADFSPIPSIFTIQRVGKGVSISIPRYMTFDVKRHFPSDIKKVVRNRSLWDDNPFVRPKRRVLHPFQYYLYLDTTIEEKNRLIRRRYKELMEHEKRLGSSPRMWKIYDTLNEEFTISIADDEADQRRQVRRYLKSIGIITPRMTGTQ